MARNYAIIDTHSPPFGAIKGARSAFRAVAKLCKPLGAAVEVDKMDMQNHSFRALANGGWLIAAVLLNLSRLV
jgi:hypothetical protein